MDFILLGLFFGIDTSAIRGRKLFDDKGNVTNQASLIAAAGFSVGMDVTSKKTGPGKIHLIDDKHVGLDFESFSLQIPADSFLHEGFRPHTMKKEQEKVDWFENNPTASLDMQLQVLKSRIIVQMMEQWESKEKQLKDSVQVWKFPKDVTSAKEFQAGKLLIPCTTSKISIYPEGLKEVPSGSISIGKYKDQGGHMHDVCLQGVTQYPKESDPPEKQRLSGFLNPFWLVPRVEYDQEAEEDPNLELTINEKKLSSQRLTLDRGAPNLPFLRNKRKLEENESLTWHRPKRASS